MSTDPVVTEDAILAKATEKSFERGMDYYDSGMVESVIQRGNRLFAEVLGSEELPYNVGVTLREDDFSATCTCPYEWEGYCKHVVATLLTFVHERGLVAVRAPIEDLLAGLDADELRGLVIHMIESDPKSSEVVDRFCRQAAPVHSSD